MHRYYGYPLPPGAGGWATVAALLRPLEQRWRTIPPYVPHGRLLDVGCGSGAYLIRVRRLGWDGYGLDASAQACAAAALAGLAVVQGTLQSASWPPGAFDVATLWHSLEHMEQPVDALRRVWRLLVPGGLLMLETPNWDSLQHKLWGTAWFHLDAVHHRVYFTPASLAACLERAGFAAVRVRTVPSTVGVTGSLARWIGLGRRHQPLLKALVWPAEALASAAGRGGCLMATGRKP